MAPEQGPPPDMAALMAQMGGTPGAPEGGNQPMEGEANLAGAQPPLAPIDEGNSGTLPVADF